MHEEKNTKITKEEENLMVRIIGDPEFRKEYLESNYKTILERNRKNSNNELFAELRDFNDWVINNQKEYCFPYFIKEQLNLMVREEQIEQMENGTYPIELILKDQEYEDRTKPIYIQEDENLLILTFPFWIPFYLIYKISFFIGKFISIFFSKKN